MICAGDLGSIYLHKYPKSKETGMQARLDVTEEILQKTASIMQYRRKPAGKKVSRADVQK